MDQTRKRNAGGTRFAVNRVYQPARIERQLLAQIFELVEQGGRKDFGLCDGPQEPVGSVTSAGLKDHLATNILGVDNATQIIELEEVA